MVTNIVSMDRKTADNIVTTVHWDCSVTDGDHHANIYGSQSFTRDADSPTLVAYADLTKAKVAGWLTLDKGLEANLLAQIAEKKAPTAANGIPW